MEFFERYVDICHSVVVNYKKYSDMAMIDKIGDILVYIYPSSVVLTQSQKNDFFNEYKEYLYAIAQTLRLVSQQNKKFRFSVNKMRPVDAITSFLEPIFSYNTLMKKLLNFIAVMTREFMKGITYFQRDGADESRDRPIYHRDVSCGSRQALHELDCSVFFDSPDEFLRRSTKNKNCTIERQVYDKIFSRYFPSREQDFGHRMMETMSKREEYFNKCYPGTTIDVLVIFNVHQVPKRLSITLCSPTRISAESYSKTCNSYDRRLFDWNDIANLDIDAVMRVYQDDVSCNRLVYDKENSLKVFTHKVQSFTNPVDKWESENIEHMQPTNSFSNNSVRSHLATRRA